MALVDTFIRAVKHSGKAGNDKHADTLGLYLAVTPSGGKLWRMDYRFSGKRKTLALGAGLLLFRQRPPGSMKCWQVAGI